MIPIIFEDDFFVALDKPAGLTVTKAESVKEPTLEDYLAENYSWALKTERSGIIHRLDKDTSGIILVAKSDEAQKLFQSLFHDRFVIKTYTALVHGGFDVVEGEISGAIARNPKNREKFAVLSEGREAQTNFRVLRRFKANPFMMMQERERMTKKEKKYFEEHASTYSLVACFPKTGRTHQIRVHMQHIGHPLVGDTIYTNKKLYRLDHEWCVRHFLHASDIAFNHPITNTPINLHTDLPADLANAMGFLEKHSVTV